MPDEEDPLAKLVIRQEQVDKEQRAMLVSMVLPFAAVDPEKGRVHFKTPFDDLNGKQKVLIYLLARLALSALPDAKLPAAASAKEVETDTGLPGGTVRPRLRQLAEERVITGNDEGYSVLPSQLKRAYGELETVINGN